MDQVDDKDAHILKALLLFERAEDIEGKGGDADEILEAAATFTARSLGYRVELPSNLSYTSITQSPDADPYANRELFEELPDYGTDLADAMRLAPGGHDLSLHQEGDAWRAHYRLRGDAEATREWSRSRHPARAVAMAALKARSRPGQAA